MGLPSIRCSVMKPISNTTVALCFYYNMLETTGLDYRRAREKAPEHRANSPGGG